MLTLLYKLRSTVYGLRPRKAYYASFFFTITLALFLSSSTSVFARYAQFDKNIPLVNDSKSYLDVKQLNLPNQPNPTSLPTATPTPTTSSPNDQSQWIDSSRLHLNSSKIATPTVPSKTTPTQVSPMPQQSGGVLNGIAGTFSWLVTFGNPVQVVQPKNGFTKADIPHFTLRIPQQDKEKIGKALENRWVSPDEQIQATIVSGLNGKRIPVVIKKDKAGEFVLTAKKTTDFTPGNYHLEITAKESFIYTRDLTQDFSWGVLSINTEKSMYTPGETAKLTFGLLDEEGHTVCNGKFTLTITTPDNQKDELSSDDGKIIRSNQCRGDTVTEVADYAATYKLGKAGAYQMHLVGENKNGKYSIDDFFLVKDTVPFVIDRTKFPTRIFPQAGYDVSLTIHANQDYQGRVSDYVPQSFQIINTSDNGTVETPQTGTMTNETLAAAIVDATSHLTDPTYQKKYHQSDLPKVANHASMPITWTVDWKSGQTYTLSYRIYFPQLSPEFYLVGPFTIGKGSADTQEVTDTFNQIAAVDSNNQDLSTYWQQHNLIFQEVRQWQIADDATKCWTGAGADSKWSTTGNWASGSLPGTTTQALFDPSTCAFALSNKAVQIDTDPGVTGTGGGVKFTSSYTNGATQSAATTLNVTGTLGWDQAGGNFLGNNADINVGLFSLTGGTFTSTTTTVTDNANWTVNGGTFSANGGTLHFGNTSSTISPSTETYNNVTFDGNGQTYAVASGKTFTILGTMTINAISGTLNGPGGIEAKGDITHNGNNGFIGGNAIITVDGSTDQNWSGGSGGTIPGIKINKPSGTFFIKNSESIGGGSWEWDQGTVDATTNSSTIRFGVANTATTITGSATFYNLTFDGNHPTMGIASGTVLTVAHTLSILNQVDVNGPGTIVAQGDLTMNQTTGSDNVTITFSGSSNQTITNTSSGLTGNVTINKTGGTVTLATNWGLTSSGQTLTLSGGTLDLAGFNLKVNGTFTVNGSATLKLQGAEIDPTDTVSVGGTSTVQYTGTGTYAKLGAGTSYYNITFSGAGSWTAATASAVLGNFTLSAGTYTAPSSLTVGGNFNTNGGTFTHNNGTVTFNDSTQTTTLSGSTTFYNLTSVTVGKTIIFTNGTTQTVSNALTLSGANHNFITLKSSSGGSQWNFNDNGTQSLTYLRVSDSNACGGTTQPLVETSGGNGGHNSCWTFSGIVNTKSYKSVTIDHTKVTATQTNFPVLVSEPTDTDLQTNAKSDGTDIYFATDSKGTSLLNYEIEKYTTSTGEIEAWVNIPSLSSTVDTVIYMLYGDGTIHTTPANAWNSNYVMVNHLGETSGTTIKDSTSNAINATTHGGLAPLTTGQIDGAQTGSAGSYYITGHSSTMPTTDVTGSAWIKSSTFGSKQSFLEQENNFIMEIQTNRTINFQINSTTVNSTSTVTSGIWNYIVATRTGSTMKIYINGVLDATTGTDSSTIGNDAGCGVMVGADITSNPSCTITDGQSVIGGMDEVRYSKVGLTQGWITTEYNNQNSPSTFETFGSAISAQSSVEVTRVNGGTKIRGGTTIQGN